MRADATQTAGQVDSVPVRFIKCDLNVVEHAISSVVICDAGEFNALRNLTLRWYIPPGAFFSRKHIECTIVQSTLTAAADAFVGA